MFIFRLYFSIQDWYSMWFSQIRHLRMNLWSNLFVPPVLCMRARYPWINPFLYLKKIMDRAKSLLDYHSVTCDSKLNNCTIRFACAHAPVLTWAWPTWAARTTNQGFGTTYLFIWSVGWHGALRLYILWFSFRASGPLVRISNSLNFSSSHLKRKKKHFTTATFLLTGDGNDVGSSIALYQQARYQSIRREKSFEQRGRVAGTKVLKVLRLTPST